MGQRLPPPAWAIHTATPNDREEALSAHQRGVLWADWDRHPKFSGLNYVGQVVTQGPSRTWAKERGWPTPWWSFKKAFLTTMLESDENFLLALTEAGVKLYYPKKEHKLSEKELRELDDLYSERSPDGRPTGWNRLVEELRDIRRAVEAGVIIRVGNETLDTWNTFYDWAHGRYHVLEDGCDHWIGDDRS